MGQWRGSRNRAGERGRATDQLTARVTSTGNPATLRPCSSAPAGGSYVGLRSRGGSSGMGVPAPEAARG
eukprot:11793880-Alexandrium_andersonii.AAC.1